MRDLTAKEKWLIIRKRIAACTLLLCIIAYVITSYYTNEWRYTLFIFLAVPIVPTLLGLQGLNISYELVVIVAYLSIGFSTKQWHPWWVLFLTIPVYHILFHDFKWAKLKINTKEKIEDFEDDEIKISSIFKNQNKRDYMDAEVKDKDRD